MAFFWTSLVLLTVLRQAASQGAYLGCYVDQEDARDFPYVMTWSDLTPQKCIRHCADLGYAYAGLQYAVECFCGDSYGTYGPAPESDCHHACSGGGAHACGGGWRNSVWSTGAAVLTEDQLELVFEDNFDTLDLSKWQPEITAGGGGNEEFQLYLNHPENLYVRDGTLFLKPTLSAGRYGEKFLVDGVINLRENMLYLGCYHDGGSLDSRDLSGDRMTSADLTPRLCLDHCSAGGYTYAGLQYGTECFCGDSFGQFGAAPESECTTPCAGDAGQVCGNGWKNSIYTSAGGRCTLENWNGCYMAGSPSQHLPPVLSARITTARSFSFRYGKVEVQAKMPTGDWIWPAIWLLPQAWVYGDWPKSGEIDIVETRGNRNLYASWGASLGVDVTTSTLHWGPSGVWPYNGFVKTRAEKEAHTGTYGSDFHNWTMVWTDQYLKFSVDDEVMLTVSPPHGFWALGDFGLPDSDNPWIGASRLAPFDQDFYLIMNVATGGTNGFFMDDYVNMPYPKPWSNSQSRSQAMEHFWQARHQWLPTWDPNANNGEDAAMQVKSVKVWKFRDL
ncbi:PREDICTED: beta-1,3-glucan-binding protein-like [Branchiostoma belcheri]|uniref:Beta-1,3-glucan-binding protein-like n=1 Tax=Branchiostoma belcheri TaxID=7741 RepID=A0A6P4YVF2_BRABE|nr:PREDICTED: beta-1,3-glucan-binding protein-like [Branchiostoma belcheri]